MGSLSSAMWIAAQALDVNQEALDVTSNNIANQDTAGYTREVPILEENPAITDGSITYGNGVELTQIQSIRDQVLELQIAEQNQQQSSAQAQTNALQQVQSLFSSSTEGIGANFTAFFSSLSELSTNPTSEPNREAVLTAAQNLAGDFQQTESNLDTIQSGLNQTVGQTVSQINTITAQIAQLNPQVGAMEKLGEDPGTLGDQEDELIQQLSQLTNVQVTQTETGVTISTGNGTPLVVGGQSYALQTTTSSSGMTDVVSAQGQDITSAISGGSLGGTIQVRDTDIPSVLTQLDNLASQFGTAVNNAQEKGYDENGNKGQALFSFTAGADAASTFKVAITDPSLIAASSDGTAGSDGNIANLLAVQTANLPSGASPIDTYSNLVDQCGNLTSQAESEVTSTTTTLNQLNNQLGAISGVSIDEETTNLMNYQRAYEAAARVITTVDDLTQSILQMGADASSAP